jgi:hypothetical protein
VTGTFLGYKVLKNNKKTTTIIIIKKKGISSIKYAHPNEFPHLVLCDPKKSLKIIIPDGGAKTCPIFGGKKEE